MKILYIEKDGNVFHWYIFDQVIAEMNKIKLWNGETSVLQYDKAKAEQLAKSLWAKLIEAFKS